MLILEIIRTGIITIVRSSFSLFAQCTSNPIAITTQHFSNVFENSYAATIFILIKRKITTDSIDFSKS